MRYRPEVDGLRAIAVLPVILFHAGFKVFSGGFVGVDIFFVISGYLITSIIDAELREGSFSIVKFYERRARRILPALFLVMAVSWPFAWQWLMAQEFKSFSQSLVAVVLFASNILFWQTSGYFEPATEMKPMLHTWSLAVEEQYYVFFPLLLILLRRMGQRGLSAVLALLFLFSLGAAQWGSKVWPEGTFYLLPSRGWELLIGALVALHGPALHNATTNRLLSQAGSLAGLVLVGWAIFTFDGTLPYPSVYALVPTVGAALLILFATPRTWAGRLLGSRIPVGIGLLSYSAYLWHQPIMAFARHRNLAEPSHMVMGLLVLLTFALSYLTWRHVEAPFRGRSAISRNKVFSLAAAGSLFFLCLGVAGHLTKGFPSRFGAEVNQLQSINMDMFGRQVNPCWNRFSDDPHIRAACHIGMADKPAEFVLLGDSHAGALLREIDDAAKTIGVAGLSYTFRSCPPVKGIELVKSGALDQICSGIRKSFFENLAVDNVVPHTLVVAARWSLLLSGKWFDNGEGGVEEGEDWLWDVDARGGNYPEKMKSVMLDSIEIMLRSGRRVILVYPVPEMGWQVPFQLAKSYAIANGLSPESGSTSYRRYLERNRMAIEALDGLGERSNLIRIRPDRVLCDSFVKDRCVAHLEDHPLYFDDDHLSNAGARMVVAEIVKVMAH